MSQKLEPANTDRIKEISTEIIQSMLKRSYPAVNATHFFKKYAVNGKPDQQFAHTLKMLEEGGILRIDIKQDPFSVTFVLLENNKAKMHHMVNDEFSSNTFGCMINDPYEGDKKRQTCYNHLKNGYTVNCEKCELERTSQVCMAHNNILSECEKCKKHTQELKKVVSVQQKDSAITAILEEYKGKYWSFGN